ncbi:hypothetical protein K7432_015469 [Basidiobolus ranarum]|uniref:Extracellular membrane protein CFEM domain-containing protein n=1 Tax=Basidiobolus ranarum TaxID=34480 RepID=A0ABR2WG77_9FUNG
MRSTLLVASTVVLAAVAVQSVDFPFKSPGECAAACAQAAGEECMPDYTSNPEDANFVKSLSCLCGSDVAKTQKYISSNYQCIGT